MPSLENATKHWSKRKLCVWCMKWWCKILKSSWISIKLVRLKKQDLVSLSLFLSYGMHENRFYETVIHFQVLSRHSAYSGLFFFFSLFCVLSRMCRYIQQKWAIPQAYRTQNMFRTLEIESVLLSKPTNIIIYSSIMKTLYRHDIRHKSQENYYRLTYSQFTACNEYNNVRNK